MPGITSKIIAVHLNYRSRAEQRGRIPREPSYFFKPPSSLARDGDPIVRPPGTELLAFEGEIAVVIGRRARHVAVEAAAGCIGWFAPANDVGLHDLRWADRGSNVLSKGHDGFTPIGPMVEAAQAPVLLTLTTRVNGEVRQQATSEELLFSFADLIADLSRVMTLEPGDVILTGTPAGAGVAEPGDEIEVELSGAGVLHNRVVEGDIPLALYGAQPRATPESRAFAFGVPVPRPVELSDAARAALSSVSTATLTVQLARRGIRDTFIRGVRPTRPDLRLLGYATTLRYVALREDVRDADAAELNQQKQAVESISPGDVLVIEARGETGAGTIGDILAARVLARGGAGIVTDGGMRDSPAVGALEIPTYFRAPHAAVLGLLHYPLERNVPITCGGVLVMPGDVVVGDAEGVVILPAALAEEIAADALEQERREAWALERVKSGESIRGVYPLSPERRADYEAWLAAQPPDVAPGQPPAERESR
jgi:5-oxopent-3-ene-1,2,5-tricarboxylate decarboxylase/2-hydroxyhepta-2,4-diene-1,7-dioate isomerase